MKVGYAIRYYRRSLSTSSYYVELSIINYKTYNIYILDTNIFPLLITPFYTTNYEKVIDNVWKYVFNFVRINVKPGDNEKDIYVRLFELNDVKDIIHTKIIPTITLDFDLLIDNNILNILLTKRYHTFYYSSTRIRAILNRLLKKDTAYIEKIICKTIKNGYEKVKNYYKKEDIDNIILLLSYMYEKTNSSKIKETIADLLKLH